MITDDQIKKAAIEYSASSLNDYVQPLDFEAGAKWARDQQVKLNQHLTNKWAIVCHKDNRIIGYWREYKILKSTISLYSDETECIKDYENACLFISKRGEPGIEIYIETVFTASNSPKPTTNEG